MRGETEDCTTNLGSVSSSPPTCKHKFSPALGNLSNSLLDNSFSPSLRRPKIIMKLPILVLCLGLVLGASIIDTASAMSSHGGDFLFVILWFTCSCAGFIFRNVSCISTTTRTTSNRPFEKKTVDEAYVYHYRNCRNLKSATTFCSTVYSNRKLMNVFCSGLFDSPRC
jgi:hypothetical protein